MFMKDTKESILSQDELIPVLVEVEATINSRPLSVISASDIDEPLIPSHQITGHCLLNLLHCHWTKLRIIKPLYS